MNICDKIRFLTVKVKARIYGFPIIKVEDEAINYFKHKVKGNKNKSDIEIIKKINRDFYSGQQIYKDVYFIIAFYGYLRIHYNVKSNEIYFIQNYKPYSVGVGCINQELKTKLNKLYGIKESK